MLLACFLWMTHMSATINMSLCPTEVPGPECSNTAISFWFVLLSGASALETTETSLVLVEGSSYWGMHGARSVVWPRAGDK